MSWVHGRWVPAAWLLLTLCAPARTEPPPVQPEGAARTDGYGDPLPAGAIARLGTVRLRHIMRDYSGAACVAFSPDGKTLVSGGDVGVLAWDVATGKELGWFRDRFPATAAHFSADGKVLITADNSGSIRHWQVGKGDPSRQIRQAQHPPFGGMASFLSADGKVAGAWDFIDEIRLWDVENGKQILARKQKPLSRGQTLFFSAALSPDGKLLVVSGESNRAHLVDIATGKEIRQIEGPNPAPHLKPGFSRTMTEAVYWFAFSPDGGLVAATGKDSVCMWDVRSGKLRYAIKGSHGRLAFSPDGKYLACGDEGAIRLFVAADGKEVRRFERHAGFVHALAFSPDGRNLASAQGYAVSLWDVATGKRVHHFPGHESPVACLAFSPDGTTLASGDNEDGILLVWDLARRTPRHSFTGHFPGVLSVAYSPDGKIIATGDGYHGTGGMDAQIRLYSAAEGLLLKQFPGHLNGVQSLAFSPDGQTLASAGYDARAKLWDVATGKRLHQIRGADSALKSAAFSPDGKILLLASSSGELALWHVDSGRKLRDLGAAGDEGRAVLFAAFLADGKTILAREFSQGRRVPRAQRVLAKPAPPIEPVTTSEVLLWEADSGRLLRSFPISTAQPYNDSYALSPDGKTLATTGRDYRDSAIQLWDTTTGRPLGRLNGHTGGAVTSLAFSPDGRTLASGGRDTTVLLWDVPRARLEHLWSELAGGRDDAARAIKKLAARPAEAIPFLRERLRRAAELEARASSLIPNLDDDNFAVREKATRELEELGPEAAFALRLALQGSPTVEVRARIQRILDKMKTPEGEPQGFDPRSVWLSLAVLEEIGTPEARQVLQELAKGPAKSTLVRQAKAALERLAKQGKRP